MANKELDARYFRDAFHKVNEARKPLRDAQREIKKEEKKR